MRAASRVIVVCVIVILGVGVALLLRREPERAHTDMLHPTGPRADLTLAQQLELERIATLGYVVGVEPSPARSGVLKHVADEVFPGFTLYTSAEDPYALLIDMEGNVVHSW